MFLINIVGIILIICMVSEIISSFAPDIENLFASISVIATWFICMTFLAFHSDTKYCFVKELVTIYVDENILTVNEDLRVSGDIIDSTGKLVDVRYTRLTGRRSYVVIKRYKQKNAFLDRMIPDFSDVTLYVNSDTVIKSIKDQRY